MLFMLLCFLQNLEHESDFPGIGVLEEVLFLISSRRSDVAIKPMKSGTSQMRRNQTVLSTIKSLWMEMGNLKIWIHLQVLNNS